MTDTDTSVKIITPPSLHLATERPRFHLIGPGNSWKHAFYSCLQDTWTDRNQSVYYCEGEEDYIWHYYQLPHTDFTILSASGEVDDAFYSFVGHLSRSNNAYLSITPWINQEAVLIFSEENPANVIIDPKSLILHLKELY